MPHEDGPANDRRAARGLGDGFLGDRRAARGLVVRAAIIAATLVAIGRVAERGLAKPGDRGLVPSALPATSADIPCPAGTLPDDGACIPVGEARAVAPELASARNTHRDRLGRVETYDHIPLRPERSADYRKYMFPIPVDPAGPVVGSGYDLHLPDDAQRRGAHFSEVGHGGVDLPAPRGTAVRVAALEHAATAPNLLFTGELFGTTVVTHHVLREGDGQREYLVIYGHLERSASGVRAGDVLANDAIVGFVGDSGSPGVVHLHLEIRRVRDGIRVRDLAPRELVHNARTIAVDPRNVLALRAEAR